MNRSEVTTIAVSGLTRPNERGPAMIALSLVCIAEALAELARVMDKAEKSAKKPA
jgi:hypothetical protein